MTGKEFRKWRRSQEISQQEVADNVKCSKSAICRWESGEIDFRPMLYERVMNFYKERNRSSNGKPT